MENILWSTLLTKHTVSKISHTMLSGCIQWIFSNLVHQSAGGHAGGALVFCSLAHSTPTSAPFTLLLSQALLQVRWPRLWFWPMRQTEAAGIASWASRSPRGGGGGAEAGNASWASSPRGGGALPKGQRSPLTVEEHPQPRGSPGPFHCRDFSRREINRPLVNKPQNTH